MKGIHVTYHPHNVDTYTFSHDAVAGISVEGVSWTAVRFPFSIGFQFSAGISVILVARLVHGMKGIHVTYHPPNVDT